MEFFIYLRRTQDYKNSKNFLIPKKILKFWNSICSVEYKEYRSCIKNLAKKQWNFPVIMGEDYKKTSDEDIILPIDDDDWFHPNLYNLLLEKTKNFDIGHWNTLVNVSKNNFRLNIWSNHHKEICSNSYFIKSKILKQSKNSYYYLNDHMKVLPKATNEKLKILNMQNNILSVYNWHPGSLSVLQNLKNFKDFLNIFPKNNLENFPKAFDWAKKPIEEFNNILSNIKLDFKHYM